MLAIALIFIPTQVGATSTHTVTSGQSLWKIANQHGVSVTNLIEANQLTGTVIFPGQRLTIPSTISAADQALMAQLVHAEAKGEPYAGKVAVATVVLNRVDHPEFPNTVRNVIYERSAGGHYAFTPVQNGAINQTPDADSIAAVKEALAFRGQGQGSIYFYNPRIATNEWIRTREVTIVIGNHRFAK
ncbi:cell wall hydrolase [Natronobacillus azotifigens]|uniref:Cell wall hydrolase n=2 Tax=Natronobacillus azotifigens TaxID=472978 RepID=A0A9J6REB0_9BACI|nr:cell wall hydrolase [Natronobacillus azotifigens]MCZ0703895.1 cell wall hydrolase [Natronobacillus azotifigens]